MRVVIAKSTADTKIVSFLLTGKRAVLYTATRPAPQAAAPPIGAGSEMTLRGAARTAFLVLSLCGATGVQAQSCAAVPLVGAGPVDPSDGFPEYYLDSNNLPLAQCLDFFCDPALTVPDPAQPIVF